MSRYRSRELRRDTMASGFTGSPTAQLARSSTSSRAMNYQRVLFAQLTLYRREW